MALLRVVDFETTGMEATDQVVEVGFCDFNTETRQVLDGDCYLCGVDHIPPEARAVHHITKQAVEGLPAFDLAKMIERAKQDEIDGFAAHVAEFEAKWLVTDIPLVCTYKAALRIWPEAPSHSNFGLLYWLEDQGKVTYQPGKAQPSHRALPDAYATAILLGAIYDAGYSGKDLTRWTREPRLLPRCTIGQHRNKPWPEVPQGFLEWMLKQQEMEEDLKWNAQQELNRRATHA